MNKIQFRERTDFLRIANLKKNLLELFGTISWLDILLILIFPLVISTLMFLPEQFQISLRLHLSGVSWWQFFTSSFTHQGLDHYKSNIFMLIPSLFFGLILSNAVREKNRYFKMLYLVVGAFPILESLISIFLYKKISFITITSGSSGLVSAILAFIPILICHRLAKRTKLNLLSHNLFMSLVLFFITTFVLYYYAYIKLPFAVVILVLLLIFFTYMARNEYYSLLKGFLVESRSNIFMTYIIILAIIFSPILFLSLFPKQFITSSGFVGFIIHFLGFTVGLYAAFYFFRKSPVSNE